MRYALLTGQTYYPSPGWQAFRKAFATIEEASEVGKRECESYEWWQVVDTQTLTIVAGEGEGHSGLYGKVRANPNA